jgi:hypothetical protein
MEYIGHKGGDRLEYRFIWKYFNAFLFGGEDGND